MSGPDRAFWQQRFVEQHLPWDRGGANPQLARWLADGTLIRGDRVALPGCGAGHEIEPLARAGLEVTAIDYASAAIALVARRLASSPEVRATLVEADVLAWQPGTPLDAVYEQTCLCALHPDHWIAYALQLRRWLRPGGRLCLLAMQAPRPGAREGRVEGPPYHVDINALRALLPQSDWQWPKLPYVRIDHPSQADWAELALVLVRR
ncbi:methyltransferase domain-containing protein [Rivibacter subsaxonicus]|uniref:Thiopurine S-methyltransferase n=1 Tax=Rivibacter subsaxonicus TaxID=457575 RepID=A0A4Q7VZL2_9BURK|nr:methyltransferase domain-containing protein [Rivibacter subsaxonicus]RZU01998.1 thiopurine S-methyltransferase [Rivibacter subsaxonicus]